jgi:hypothetical protein
MFGVMDNNMGFHKERLALRPTTSHPEIKTDGSMFEFVFSSFYSMSSRSILVLARGVFMTLESFTDRLINSFTNTRDYNQNYNSFNSLSIGASLTVFFGNIINVIVSFFYNIVNTVRFNITGFSLSAKLLDAQTSLAYLMSLDTLLGLTDFSFGI